MNIIDLDTCFHCHLPIPRGVHYVVHTDEGKSLPMCCPGCKAVTETILTLGLSQFYEYRDTFPEKAIDLIPPELSRYTQFDNPEIYKEYVDTEEDEEKEAFQSITLYIEGVTCAACVWLLENRLRQLPGVKRCVINLSNHIAVISWYQSTIKLSQLLMEITQLGYKAHLSHVTDIEKHQKQETDSALKRLGVAGLGAMQVMMIAVGLYAGAMQGIEPQYKHFFKWVSMIVSVPVFFYVGYPFIKSGIRSIQNKQLGMDVPIAIALIAVMFQSILMTLIGNGDVYFDSVCMFLFFLTLGRYLEMRVRHKASDTLLRLTKLLPTTVLSISLEDEKLKENKLVPISSVKNGDVLMVEKGQNIPCDGILLQGKTSVNEAMLTGEFMPKSKDMGAYLYAGTQNISQDLFMKVTKVGDATKLLSITNLLSHAQSKKPHILSLANTVATWFVGVVLIVAFLSGFAWYFIDRTEAFWVMLSVLVISCPCALSLATPIVLTISMNKLSERGVLVMNNRVIEGMSNISHCVFDKTGTLTVGELTVDKIVLLSAVTENDVLAIAGSLEVLSEHPIAMAITQLMNKRQLTPRTVIKGEYVINRGVEGMIDGQLYRIGQRAFSSAIYDNNGHDITMDTHKINIVLADSTGPLALFCLTDRMRPDAKETVSWLKTQGITPILLTGDASHVAKKMADDVGISLCYHEKTPEDKLSIIKKLSEDKHRVLVVGDGTNDVLAMAGAYLSFAMGAGTDLAKTHSDAVLLNNKLSLLKEVFHYTRRSKAVIKQNIAWAILYNLIALPVAALGWVHPYLAVMGMSASSLIVTLNALRLKRFDMFGTQTDTIESPTELSLGAAQ